MIQALIPVLAPILGNIIKSKFPDPQEQAKVEAEVNQALWMNAHQLNIAAAEIIKAEAASDHWLAANWRPLMMLVFGGLIVARWFGWATPELSEAEYLKLWDIVQLGIGGYTIGRSVEKVLPSVMDAVKTRK